MIQTVFLIAALALPVGTIHHATQDDGGYHNPESHDIAIREWKWIEALLEQMYPGHEFIILHKDYGIVPKGWIEVPFWWRSHVIYRRNKTSA